MMMLAERVRAAIAERPVTFEGRDISVTMSFGAAWRGTGDLATWTR